MNLTTVARAKAILAAGAGTLPSGDPLIANLIGAASDACCQWTGRTFMRATLANLVLNGRGQAALMMPINPIVSITAPITVDGYQFRQVPDNAVGGPNITSNGYTYDRKFVYLCGGAVFTRGKRNVVIAGIVSGFTTSESGVIPNSSPATLTPITGAGVDAQGSPITTGGYAFVDQGVTLNGVAAAKVASAPSAGQYSFLDGVYTFNQAGDNGKTAVMTYDFVPFSVEQAAIEMVGLKVKQRDNFGIASKSIGQETVTYSDVALSKSVQSLLQPYRFVIAP